MFRTYWKLAIRNLWQNKFFSAINIAGLAIGISAAIVIFLMVIHEFSFEEFHPNKERIYRVVSQIDFPDLQIHSSGVPVPTAAATRKEIPGIEKVTHFIAANSLKVTIEPSQEKPRIFKQQKKIIYTDPDYFKIFSYTWLKGSSDKALDQPYQVVLSKSRAVLYFPGINEGDMVGRTISYDDSIKVTVTGIVDDLKGNTDFKFKEFISSSTIAATGLRQFWSWDEWGSINDQSQMFVLLAPGTNPKKIVSQLAVLRDKYREKDPDQNGKKDDTRHHLQQLKDIHFNGDYGAFQERLANKKTLYGLLIVAFFLLFLACINYINLSTALGSTRSKEIGIRKTMGGSRPQLLIQFFSETCMMTIMATLLSLLILPWVLQIFGKFIPPEITFNSINNWQVWIFLVVLILVVSFLSGYYPAMYLSKFKPITILKRQSETNSGRTQKAYLRKTLTVTQFMIAQFLLLATIVVSKQIQYSLNKEMGFKKDAIVFINTPWFWQNPKLAQNKNILIQTFQQYPEVELVSLGSSSPASTNTSTTTMVTEVAGKKLETMVEIKYADTNYFKLYGMKLLAGRNVQQSDTTREFVVNATYAKMMGFKNPEDAIGHYIERRGKIPIVGVLTDFHTKSTHEPIKPLAYSCETQNSYTIHVALKSSANNATNWKTAVAKMETEFSKFYPDQEPKVSFFDESITAFYENETNIASLLKWSAALCVLICSLGLLGLVVFTTNSRTKEIGIRKVLGASIPQIVILLSKDFMALVLIACVISMPIAWLVMNNWLEDYVYRTNLNWWLFAVSGISMLTVAMLTLSFRTIRTAAENPVNSLRSE